MLACHNRQPKLYLDVCFVEGAQRVSREFHSAQLSSRLFRPLLAVAFAGSQCVSCACPTEAAYLGEVVALVDEVQQLGDDLLAAAHVNLRVVEDAALLQHGTLLDAIEWRELHCHGVPHPRSHRVSPSSVDFASLSVRALRYMGTRPPMSPFPVVARSTTCECLCATTGAISLPAASPLQTRAEWASVAGAEWQLDQSTYTRGRMGVNVSTHAQHAMLSAHGWAVWFQRSSTSQSFVRPTHPVAV